MTGFSMKCNTGLKWVGDSIGKRINYLEHAANLTFANDSI